MSKKNKYPHLSYKKFLIPLLRKIVNYSFQKKFGAYTEDTFITNFPSPYILLLQHSSAWDPIVYHSFINTPIHYVVSDAHFRSPIMRFILGLVGSIVKKKSTSDIRTAMEMLYVLKNLKESVGIFAEGVNNWDGVSLPVVESTAKLIKHAKLPVICARSHGAYSTFPRWAKLTRKGKWKAEFSLCIEPDEIKTMTEEQILTRITKYLNTNEHKAQRKNPVSFIGKNKAQYIERVLFACPICEGVQCIKSEKNYFTCTNCCSLWHIDDFGFFALVEEHQDKHILAPSPFADLHTWNVWQNNFLQTQIHKDQSKKRIIFCDEDIVLKYGENSPTIDCGLGTCTLSHKTFIFQPYNTKKAAKDKIGIDIPQMNRVNVQNNEKLEWTTDDDNITYQVRSKHPNGNMYKYMQAIHILQK